MSGSFVAVKMVRMKISVVFCLTMGILLFCRSAGYAQNPQSELLSEIRRAYEKLNYAEAEIKALSALKEYQRFSPTQLTEVHKILAIVYFSQNKRNEARTQFESAVSLNPDLTLDPMMVSPKILQFFEEVKRQMSGFEDRLRSNDAPEIKYILLEDPRPAAAMRSLILPGWGQQYKGENRKGIILTSLWAAGLAGSIAAHVARDNANDKYLAETEPDKIESRFATFNDLHKLRNNLALFTASVWLFSYLDAFLRKTPSADGLRHPQKRTSFAPSISPGQAYLSLQFRF